MHAQRASTAGILEDVDGILWIGMDIAEHPAGLVGAYGDEAEVKGAAVTADLRKGRAGGEVVVGGGIVIFCLGDGGRDGAVACVTVLGDHGS